MEQWSKEKTMKLIELMQMHANIWNSALCDTRRDKQKRKEQLRNISDLLGISMADTTKKIQHLRTQYNREAAREVAFVAADPAKMAYISSWYAYEYLHFLKDSNKPYRIVTTEDQPEIFSETSTDCKSPSLTPPLKIPRNDINAHKPDIIFSTGKNTRDEFSVFGEYVAHELRSLKGEKNLLVAKKKIQDAIFEVKMGLINDPRETTSFLSSNIVSSLQGGKLYTAPAMSTTAHIEPLVHTTPTSGISEIIINGACHYTNFKVDSQ